jgi:N utilization substance protein B
MATRRQAREWALQMLFQLDYNPAEKMDDFFAAFWRQEESARRERRDEEGDVAAGAAQNSNAAPEARIRAFAEELVRGVADHRAEIDARLTGYLRNWALERLGGVERNVMRLAFFELFYGAATPPVVCINEAVDLAKYFSNAEAGRFVNGVLDRAARDARPRA